MRNSLFIALMLISCSAFGQRYYNLSIPYDSVQIPKLILKTVPLGTVTDTVLVLRNGRVKKIPKSSFGGGTVTSVGSPSAALSILNPTTTPSITFTGATSQYLAGDGSLQTFSSGVRSTSLAGLSTATATAIVAGDNVLAGFGKTQGQFNALPTTYVPLTRTIAGMALSADVTLTAHQVGVGLTGGTYNGSTARVWAVDQTVIAPLASPPFTGTPTAPTAASGTNTTQLATTAFVQAGFVNTTSTQSGLSGNKSWTGIHTFDNPLRIGLTTAQLMTIGGSGLTYTPDGGVTNYNYSFNSGGFILPQIASPLYQRGKLTYDTDNESLTFYNNESNVSMQVGQESWIRVVNNTGSTIANGAAVYINGSSAGLPTVALAQSNSGTTTVGAGLATQSIANGAIGYVTSLGVVNGLNTSAFAVGAVYIDPTTPGALTQTVPTAGNYRYRVGFVTVVDATVGKIHVTPTTAVRDNIVASATLDFPSTGTSTNSVLTITATGAAVGDVVSLGIPATAIVATNHNYMAWVSATNTVSIRLSNNSTVSSIDPPSSVFNVRVIK